MKVLIYHWTQDNFPKRRGGGIQLYQRAILPKLLNNKDLDVTVLSSGSPDLYDFFYPSTRIERLPSEATNLARYGLVNSPIPAPAVLFFGNPYSIKQEESRDIFFEFVKREKFDVIHFNHFEGLPVEVLTIKEIFPNIKIIFSMHDYYSICPQVTLLYQGMELCEENEGGKKCQSCIGVDRPSFSIPIRRADRMSYQIIDKIGLNPVGNNAKLIQKIFRKIVSGESDRDFLLSSSGEIFQNWHQIVDMINMYVDHVLTVSNRVSQIAERHGFNPKLMKVLRLGKNEALDFRRRPLPKGRIVEDPKKGSLNLVYLGYMTLHKGFFFMLDAFEKMPESISKRINLVVAAKSPSDPSILGRLTDLKPKLGSLIHYDGYTPDQLDKILLKGSVGLLCQLWEDTAPQTAWEMHCRQIPILTSDLGGAPELSGCEKMVYRYGNTKEFIERIRAILEGNVTHEEYWERSIIPITIDEHCNELLKCYTL